MENAEDASAWMERAGGSLRHEDWKSMAGEIEHLRADARRNRDGLLVAAAEAFTASGVNASLEEIARQAGVGVGTLYRHFPSREALIAATYRHELERLHDSVPQLQRDHTPDAALRAWMDGFLVYAAAKRGMGEALRQVMASDSERFSDVRTLLLESLDALVGRAAAAGVIRSDATGADVLRALGAIWMIRTPDDFDRDAARTLDLIMDGLRYGAPGTA